MQKIRDEKGITLVALVITIIILIILAGISINLLLGENGLINKARSGKTNYEYAANEEKDTLTNAEVKIEEIAGNSIQPVVKKKDKNGVEEGKSGYLGGSHSDPYIPVGFEHTEGSWNNGYTIKNSTTDDEFVWVPCTITATSETVKFARVLPTTSTTSSNYSSDPYYAYNRNKYTNYTDEGTSAGAIRTSVNVYEGFYIAKYEASSSNGSFTGTVQSLPNKIPFKSILRSDSITKSESMVQTSDNVKSALISGECWDTTLQWMIATGNTNYDTSSVGKAWFSDNSNNTLHNTGTSVDSTGKTEPNKINNIWDMAGNVMEWTTENCKYNTDNRMMYRGGSYKGAGYLMPAERGSVDGGAYVDVGFRVVLYKEVPSE